MRATATRSRGRFPARGSGASPLQTAIVTHGYVLLYDGLCGLCDRFVQFILRHDRGGTLRFATLQGPYGDEARKLLPELAGVDSVILLHVNGAMIRSTAALEVARYLGGMWALAAAAYVVPRVVRDWIYDWVARRRYRVFGKFDACPIPSADVRHRFLD